MKVMHLLQSTKYSGAESVVCQIIQMVVSISKDIDMIYVSPQGPIEEVLKEKEINYFPLLNFTKKEIDRAVKVLKPDIIHAHDFNASVKAAKYKNVISHLHNNASWISKVDPRTILYALCIHRYKKIIGVSQSIQKEFLFRRILEKKYITLQNVVDEKKIHELSEKECKGNIDLLYVGRLSNEKNPIRFLQIVKDINDKGFDIKATMVGQGPLYEECQYFIRRNKLTGVVEMKGFTTNPYCYMKAAKVLVMTSVFEGFGLVAVESMILGTPVLCTPVGGLLDIVDDSCGHLCNDDEEFVETILKMITDQNQLHLKSVKSKEKAAKFCDTSKYVSVLRDIYLS